MSFRIDALCLCLLTAAIPGTASALDRMERLVLEELACTDLPQSLIILSQLRDEGRIDTAQNLGYDSLSCFQIAGGLAVQGIIFTSVCAYEEDAALQAAHPEFTIADREPPPARPCPLAPSPTQTPFPTGIWPCSDQSGSPRPSLTLRPPERRDRFPATVGCTDPAAGACRALLQHLTGF